MKYQILLISLLLSICFSSCDNEAVEIPAFLEINSISFTTEPGQGTASSSIRYAFVFINEDFIGGYELPIVLPVIAEGETDVLIRAGINANGISETPDLYPAYTDYRTTINFTPQETVTVEPEVVYKSNIRFAINEEFESASHEFRFDLDQNPDTNIEIDGDGAFEGRSARITLDGDTDAAIFGTDLIVDIPKNNTPVWLEVNYNTEVPIIFGLNGVTITQETEAFAEYGINTKTSWNKIYFDLTNIVNLTEFVGYQLFFGVSIAEGQEAEVLLDNIKIVYFEN